MGIGAYASRNTEPGTASGDCDQAKSFICDILHIVMLDFSADT